MTTNFPYFPVVKEKGKTDSVSRRRQENGLFYTVMSYGYRQETSLDRQVWGPLPFAPPLSLSFLRRQFAGLGLESVPAGSSSGRGNTGRSKTPSESKKRWRCYGTCTHLFLSFSPSEIRSPARARSSPKGRDGRSLVSQGLSR